MRTALMMLVTVLDHHVEQLSNDDIFWLYTAIEQYEWVPFLRSDSAYLMEFMYQYLLDINPFAFNTPLAYVWYAQDTWTQESFDYAADAYQSQVASWEIDQSEAWYRDSQIQWF
jgi:hypothetical protein